MPCSPSQEDLEDRPLPLGNHSQATNRQAGEKTDKTEKKTRTLLPPPPKPEKGLKGGELLTMQSLGCVSGMRLSMGKAWGISGRYSWVPGGRKS